MSLWKTIKEFFSTQPLKVQFEQLLLEDEARLRAAVHVDEIVKEEEVAKAKKPAAKPAPKPAKGAKAAPKPAAKSKGKKKK